MKIIVANTAGFCMGVRRAVDLALEHTSGTGPPVYTLGKLIHNRPAVELLSNRGARELDDSREPEPGSKVLVRAHGVPPGKVERYAERGHEIVDGTCPKVKTVHRVITKYRGMGYHIVISGDKGHAEVIGLLGYAGDAGHLIQTPDDVDRLPAMEKLCLVSQTTFDKELFESIAARVRERFMGSDVVVKKTICSATERRQGETRELARSVDAMIVVGGKDSANTLRLASIATESGTPTQHVEAEKEIDWAAIADAETIGVTAGASTPHWMIKRVVEHLQLLARRESASPQRLLRTLFDLGAHLNVILAAGAGAVYYASCILQDAPYRPIGSLLAFLYFFSMYLWNSLASIEMTQHLGVSRYRFYRRYTPLLFVLAGVCIATLLSISYMVTRPLFYLMLLSTLAGTVYHVTIVPKVLLRFVRYRNLRDIPTSRDLFAALAWGVILTFAPHAIEGTLSLEPSTILTFIWVTALAYLRSLVFDLRDIEGDRIMGRETLVTIIGEKRARQGLLVAMRLLLVVVVLYVLVDVIGRRALSGESMAFLLQLLVLLYTWLLLSRRRPGELGPSTAYTAFMDVQFLLSGVMGWVAFLLRHTVLGG